LSVKRNVVAAKRPFRAATQRFSAAQEPTFTGCIYKHEYQSDGERERERERERDVERDRATERERERERERDT